jgi:hypothetical protein
VPSPAARTTATQVRAAGVRAADDIVGCPR